ncbi:MAG: DNA repair protein RecN [Syntrophales bacterium]|nr:DNA repair protein RecN [Syntrophales bacterium]
MLTELNIKNFAIIDELKVSFDDGLSVISGETGTGKSIIIGAVSLLLGEKASADMIRSSEDTAVVEALFDIGRMGILKEKLEQMGFYQGDDLVIRRVVSRSGKNKAYLNGNLVPLGLLSSVSEFLLNICSQHEHQVILNVENHLDILDELGGLLALRSEYTVVYEQYQSLSARLRELESARQKRGEREDLLGFQLQEIDAAALKTGEDAALLEEKKVLENAQKLMDYAGRVYNTLYGKEGSVLEEFRGAITNIREIKGIDARLHIAEDDLEALFYQIEDAALTIRDYAKNLSFDAARLEAIEERLTTIGRLKRKYGGTLEDVLQKRGEMEEELRTISSVAEGIERVSKTMAVLRSQAMEMAGNLSQERKSVAIRLKEAMEAEIRTLGMAGARVATVFKELSPKGAESLFNHKGIDDVEFYLASNVGETLKPLSRIASGGELSRIILAMKKVLARTGSVGTIIFDEVDSGIGGATAEIIGEKLRDVSGHHQVLCITHLPQIACFGDKHYRVTKTVSGGRTNTWMRILSEEERLEEIARMLGGVELTQKTREHAREMLLAVRRGEGRGAVIHKS